MGDGYYISNGEKHNLSNHEFRNYDGIYILINKNITEIKTNTNTRYLSCGSNQINNIKLNDGLCHLLCRYNQIKELYLPSTLIYLECDIGVKLYNKPKDCDVHLYRKTKL